MRASQNHQNLLNFQSSLTDYRDPQILRFSRRRIRKVTTRQTRERSNTSPTCPSSKASKLHILPRCHLRNLCLAAPELEKARTVTEVWSSISPDVNASNSSPVQQFMSAIGRKCSVVNLDPANDHTTYPCAIDVRNLIKLEEIMEEDDLGPNGGVLYALEELENNMEWLEQGLSELGEDYVLFDCPGQVELYTHHSSLRNIFFRLQKLGYRVRLHSCSYSG